jgi:UDP-N-acetylmuramoylalanine--D-glutamate ligase
MIPATTFRGSSVAVFGLGRSGLAACSALLAGGASAVGDDDDAAGRARAAAAGVPVADLRRADWRRFAALILAPGVPLGDPSPHWSAEMAKAAGVPIIGDIEVFCRERAAHCVEAPFIAITGTNGKSTTTALIAHMLRAAGKDAQLGGNIGTPILALAPPQVDRAHVIEMSSFQIELTPSLRPSIGVLLNISPDHLDRHGTMQAYAGLKRRLIAAATRRIIGADDDWCRAIAAALVDAGCGFLDVVSSRTRPWHGWYGEGTRLISDAPWTGPLGAFADLEGISALRGRHNLQNALAASAAALAAGAPAPVVAAALKTFPGLPHRLEEVGRLGRVLFINDSKATNADSTATALAAFAGGIFLILGGRPKPGGIAGLDAHLTRVAKSYLIGEAMDDFAAALSDKVAFERSGTLAAALAAAVRDAAQREAGPAPIVLLSPACASYDQFPNFEARGDAFRALVHTLPGIVIAGAR